MLAGIYKSFFDEDDHLQASQNFIQDNFFFPLNITTAVVPVDKSGTMMAGAFIHMTAQAWGRMGLAMLDKGKNWNGEQQVIPELWIDEMIQKKRHVRMVPDDNKICSNGRGYPHFNGVYTQMIYVCPKENLVVVRLGADHGASYNANFPWTYPHELFHEGFLRIVNSISETAPQPENL